MLMNHKYIWSQLSLIILKRHVTTGHLSESSAHKQNVAFNMMKTWRKNVANTLHCRELHTSLHLHDKCDNPDGCDMKHLVYSIVPKEKSGIISAFLMTNYHQTEPMTLALGMPVSEAEGWFQRFIRMSMYVSVHDVSVQVVDEKALSRIGVLSSVIIDPTLPRPLLQNYMSAAKHPVNAQMNEFFDEIENGLDPAKILGLKKEGERPCRILEHLYISVKPEFSRHGIGSQMVHLAESLAKNIINCRVAYVIATSEYSYKIFSKHGYKVVKELKYSDYMDSKGKKIFEGKDSHLNPHMTCRAMVKELPDLYNLKS